jgi:hypothetical protein
MLGVFAAVIALAGAAHTERPSIPVLEADHQVRDVASTHASGLGQAEALPATGRTTTARHSAKVWRVPGGLLPLAAALAAVALAALLAFVVRGRRLTETPTRLPPRAPPAARTSVLGHGVGRHPVPALLGRGAVPAPA